MGGSKRRKWVRALLLLLAMLFLNCFCASAAEADYRIYDAFLDQDSSGRFVAEWEPCEMKSPYKILLYRNSKECGTTVSVGASVTSYEFTEQIYSSGKGTYYFTIYPTKAPLLIVASGTLTVDSEMLTLAKTRYQELKKEKQKKEKEQKEQKKEGTGPGGVKEYTPRWVKNPNGTWSYYGIDGKLVKNKWLDADGYRYLFDKNGIMLTGWNFVSSRWYYLTVEKNREHGYPEGALWKNAITPDGYTVNADGMWVLDGKVVKTKTVSNKDSSTKNAGTISKKEETKKVKEISSCKVTLQTKDMGDGACRNITVKSATNSNIESVAYSLPYEEWLPGSEVRITVTLSPKDGYSYKNGCSFSASEGSVVSTKGSNTKTVVISVKPKMKLEKPQGASLNDLGELAWPAVPKAKRYKVYVSGGKNVTKKTVYVTEPVIDLWTYGNPFEDSMNVKITAMGNEGNKNYLDSQTLVIDDVSACYVSGEISYRKNGSVTYNDADGFPANGWKQISGAWYHFTKGKADGPGWYQDTDGNWYYFDESCRMLTGTVTDGGKRYVLNSGERKGLPVGAWIN